MPLEASICRENTQSIVGIVLLHYRLVFQGMTMSDFRAKDIGMRAQKKLASKLSNKTVAKMLVDDSTSQLLDNLCLLCKQVVSDQHIRTVCLFIYICLPTIHGHWTGHSLQDFDKIIGNVVQQIAPLVGSLIYPLPVHFLYVVTFLFLVLYLGLLGHLSV